MYKLTWLLNNTYHHNQPYLKTSNNPCFPVFFPWILPLCQYNVFKSRRSSLHRIPLHILPRHVTFFQQVFQLMIYTVGYIAIFLRHKYSQVKFPDLAQTGITFLSLIIYWGQNWLDKLFSLTIKWSLSYIVISRNTSSKSSCNKNLFPNTVGKFCSIIIAKHSKKPLCHDQCNSWDLHSFSGLLFTFMLRMFFYCCLPKSVVYFFIPHTLSVPLWINPLSLRIGSSGLFHMWHM